MDFCTDKRGVPGVIFGPITANANPARDWGPWGFRNSETVQQKRIYQVIPGSIGFSGTASTATVRRRKEKDGRRLFSRDADVELVLITLTDALAKQTDGLS